MRPENACSRCLAPFSKLVSPIVPLNGCVGVRSPPGSPRTQVVHLSIPSGSGRTKARTGSPHGMAQALSTLNCVDIPPADCKE